MKRILVVYYSQTGDVRRMVEAFVEPLESAGVELVWHQIEPAVAYPSPWRNPHRFFNVMPECVLGLPPEIVRPEFSPNDKFDLIILAYQVWFLSPSPPVQAFLRSEHAGVMRGRRVITLSVSRNMWQRASEGMKEMLREAGAVQIDNVVVTHQGPPWATFVTTTRSLMTGKRNRLWTIFPPAGIGEEEGQRMNSLGAAVAGQLDALDGPSGRSLLKGPLLTGLGAVEVNRRYVIPELVAWPCFRFWARVIRSLGSLGSPLRHVGIFLFVHFLLLMIVVGIPMCIVTLPFVYPLIRGRLASYIGRLQEPSGG